MDPYAESGSIVFNHRNGYVAMEWTSGKVKLTLFAAEYGLSTMELKNDLSFQGALLEWLDYENNLKKGEMMKQSIEVCNILQKQDKELEELQEKVQMTSFFSSLHSSQPRKIKKKILKPFQ